MKNYDLLIVGAGPVGLYAGFYAGMRGLSVALIETSAVAGGQPQALYPEKLIYDIAGLPAISGTDLTKNLLEQLARIPHEIFLNQRVEKIDSSVKNSGQQIFSVKTNKNRYQSKAILLTTGAGLISPRKIGISYEEELEQAGKLSYFITSIEDYRNQKIAVLGGGDSALDWALTLENVASEVHLIHRRKAFRAHEMTAELLNDSTVKIHVPYTVSAMNDKEITIKSIPQRNETPQSEEKLTFPIDKILVNYGFLTEQVTLIDQLSLTRNGKITVNSQMQSNLAGVYGAGDTIDYLGKVPLLSVGFGEAVAAINAMTKTINFEHNLRKGHSSTVFG
ncbi:NAD(P)/FAD-dependent oxidoreductase [Lactococcus nasutitermitis]|uniref:Ferredoxin--NADP reductase n=1 Tax=Lactococcus nasutitermitis TaxID=1652957 RepID=A0ABV9JDY7_9LACT|nr:NAD(P)/FAD-dependent oxidoreductase [Lactococcus nasutitermitis]